MTTPTTPAVTEAAAIAAGLSRKMRFNIRTARVTLEGDFITRAHMHMREQCALRARGLTTRHDFIRDRLTPLGLAVRDIIQEQSK